MNSLGGCIGTPAPGTSLQRSRLLAFPVTLETVDSVCRQALLRPVVSQKPPAASPGVYREIGALGGAG